MKNINISHGIIISTALSLILFLVFCKSTSDQKGLSESIKEKPEVAHSDEEHSDHAHEKMVHLNQAQFDNAGIDTAWFEIKNLSEVISANGYTKLPPQNQAKVGVPLPGTIKSIKVIEGQYVRTGQVLATLESMAYNNLRLDRAKLNEEFEKAKSNLEYLNLEYTRQEELFKENVNAKKIFEKVSSDLKIEKSKIKNLEDQINILSQNIAIGGNANSPVINILAPITGSITEVHINIGSAVQLGSPLFNIVDNSKMHVDLLVYEKDLFKVKTGQSIRFILTNQGNQEIKGKVFSVGKSFEIETKSVAVHADIINEKQILIPGMYVNALIDIGSNGVNALPIDAIVKAEGREFIFLWEKENMESEHVHQEGEKHDESEEHKHEGEEGHNGEDHEKEISFARIEVKTGASQLGYVQVTPLVEIHNGDKIVVKGAYYLQAHLQKAEGGGGHSH